MSALNQTMVVNEIVRRQSPAFDFVYFYGNRNSTLNMINIIEKIYTERHPYSKIFRTSSAVFRKETFQNVMAGITDFSAPVCDLFIFEGIEEIAGLEINEQRLYGILDQLLERRCQIIICGKTSAINIDALAPRIRAQIDGGISLHID